MFHFVLSLSTAITNQPYRDSKTLNRIIMCIGLFISLRGFTIAWVHAKKRVDISMPGYIKKYLQQFKHTGVQKVYYEPAL